MTAARYARTLRRVLDVEPITDAERAAARDWYTSARGVAAEVAALLETDIETGAAIVSAYSIRNTWTDNVAHARMYAAGVVPPGLRVRTVIADQCITFGQAALKGPKTRAFAEAIAGDPEAVPVDVWMCRAAGLTTSGPTARQHADVAAAVRRIAPDYALTPAECQALIWIRVRGSAA